MDEIILLQKILDLGISNGYFELNEIKSLDKSCCTDSSISVIDFDKTEEIHRVKHCALALKSCDALKISGTDSSIDFIEMKGMRQFMNRQLIIKTNIQPQVQEKVYSFKFTNKIRDSITILNNIVQSANFNLSGRERDLYHAIAKKYIVLTDINIMSNPLELLTLTLEFLSETSSDMEHILFEHFESEIRNIELPNYYNIQRPILMSCNDFKSYY